MRENYAIIKIIYSQGAGRDWKSTICSTIKLETMSMELDGNFTQKLGHQQANRAVNKLDQQHSNLSQRTIHGVKSLQRPTQTFKPIRSQRLGGLRTLARTFSFYRTGGRSIHSRSSVNKQQRSSQAREWQGVTRLHDTTGQSLKALLLMLVTWEDQSTGTSGQTNWTAGVSPLTSKVSLCVMSRWGALSLVTVQEQMEEGHVAALMSRTHQMGALVNEDNPQNDRQEAVTATSGMTAGDSGIKRNTSSWGMYIYGAIILMGIMVHEHKEGSRCKGRHNSQVVYRLQHYTGRFFREWMALATLQVLVLMIGVALCVPSEVSPIGFVRQTAYRTLILGAIACVWIQAHLRSSMVWLKTHQAELQQRITVRLISGGTGDAVTGNRQSMRSGRGGRGSQTGSTPRGAGSGQRSAPTQRAAHVTPGAGGAHHYNNLGSQRPFGSDRERLEVYAGQLDQTYTWTKVYVEGIPTNVTLLGRDGISAIRALIEDILGWPLAEGTDYRLAETVHMRNFPTEHGRGAGVTYGLILDLGRKELDGFSVYPEYGAYHAAPRNRLRT